MSPLEQVLTPVAAAGMLLLLLVPSKCYHIVDPSHVCHCGHGRDPECELRIVRAEDGGRRRWLREGGESLLLLLRGK